MDEIGESIQMLHVDDEPEFAEMTGVFVEREDQRFEVDSATSARVGLERLEDGGYDCVVSDYDMPGENGIEFLKHVREEYPDLPFILFTGKGSEEVASEAISAGVTDYLQKGRGTSQYSVLTNRITNAVDRYRTRSQVAELDRIRTLASDINKAIVRAESPRGVKAHVCEIISESEPYLFAWIGDIDPETNRVKPEISAGVEDGYLDEITITTEGVTGQGPGGTAIRERRVAVSQNIAEDPEFEPWREEALERGYRAVAAIPIEYQDTLYSELVVYAERADAFDEKERNLLSDVGDDIGHVLHSFDVRAELREERDFIDQSLDTLNDVFYVVSTDGTFLRWNNQLEAVTGYGGEDISKMRILEFFPEDDRGRISAAIEETLTTGETTVEAELQAVSGERIPYEFTGSRLTDSDGNLLGLIGIGRDLTERKQREQRLKRLIDNVPGMVYRCRNEPGWSMQDLGGEVQELTGYDAATLERREGFYGDRIIHPDDREDVWIAVQEALDACEPFELTYRIRTKDDAIRWVWERGRGIYSDKGDVEALDGFISDITQREHHKQAIKKLHETAQSFMRADTADQVAEIAIETVRDVLGMPANGLHLYDGDSAGLVPVAWTDRTEEIVGEPPTFAPGEGIAGRAFEMGESQIYDDISTVAERFNPDTSVRSQIVFPLDDHGVLIIGSPESNAFDDIDVSLAEIVATHATAALDRIEHG